VIKVNVRKISDRVVSAELWIGFPPLQEHYSSRVTSLYPSVVHVSDQKTILDTCVMSLFQSVCTDGRLFHMLDTTWRFGPPPKNRPNRACTLHYTLEFEFKVRKGRG